MQYTEIIKLASPHLHPSQHEGFARDLKALSEHSPVIIAFENYIGKPGSEADYAFYFKLSDFWKIENEKQTRQTGLSSYVSTIRKSRLGKIAISSPELIDGFWIEKDASRKLKVRQLAYALLKEDFEIRKLIPNIKVMRGNRLPYELLNKYVNNAKSLRQVGIVTSLGLTVGFKLVHVMEISDLCILEMPRECAQIIENYQELFSSQRILMHIAFLFGTVHSLSLELITPANERFSSCDKWITLFGNLQIDAPLQKLYNHKEIDEGHILSGISHIKVPIFRKDRTRFCAADIKLYSGILMRGKR
mgnify:CR=1 FL=1